MKIKFFIKNKYFLIFVFLSIQNIFGKNLNESNNQQFILTIDEKQILNQVQNLNYDCAKSKHEEIVLDKDVPCISGLPNIGNNCYMNVVLQCLFQIPEFVYWIKYKIDPNTNKVFTLSKNFFDSYILKDEQVKLTKIKELFDYINKNYFNNVNDVFFQQDAYALFLKFIKNFYFLESLFEFSQDLSISCPECGYVSDLISNKLCNLSYKINPTNKLKCDACSIKNLNETYFLSEDLINFNCLKCSKLHNKIIKKTEIKNFSDYLLIKIDNFFSKNISIDFNDLVLHGQSGDNRYLPIAVIFYLGNSISGHYVVLLQEYSTKEWYFCNDDIIYQLNKNALEHFIKNINSSNQLEYLQPYLFLYKKIKE